MSITSPQPLSSMHYCPFCGQQNATSALSCVRCGELQPPPPAGPSRPSTGSSPTVNEGAGRRVSASVPGVASPRRSNHGATRFLDARSMERELRSSTARDTSMQGRVKLVVQQGQIIGEQYLLSDAEIAVGRHVPGSGYCPDIELSAQDASFVHRQHARLHFEQQGAQLFIDDLGGRNGVFVNNHAVPRLGSVALKVGDKIRIGRVVLKLLDATEHERGR